MEQETGSLKESAAAAASRKSRKSQASGAQQDKEQKSSQDVTSQSAQAHEPSRQALEADEDAQGVPAQELEDRPDVQQDAETCASEKAQVRDVLKVSYVKIPKTTCEYLLQRNWLLSDATQMVARGIVAKDQW